MPANLTEGSPDANGTVQTLDSHSAVCFPTTFAEGVEEEERGSFYSSFRTEQLITLWVLFVFTMVGNAAVLFSTWKRKRKSRMTFFVTQLAVTEKQAKVLIAGAWSLSFLFSTPTLVIFGKRKLSNGEEQCWALWPDDSYWTPYMTVVAFLVYFIPLTIISVIYAIVIRTIWIKSKAQETVISNCSDGKLCTSYNRGLISRAKIKAIKYSMVIILAFICCWSPYFLFDMLDNFSLLPDTKQRFYASVIIQNLPALNSAINPLVYFTFSGSSCLPRRGEQRSRDSRTTCRERIERHEMQVVSKPEFI
ncbi:PREDICTED: neuropeptide S receptor isoform X2 [Miniopterus natalensis]|uniref:neuropeptide S receptor isoform X2 n=1 Tax=Miniopterus natalensis TaxID=291302 RepID=UPI0007A6D145|nr:PREDICTED: neuropeptide S receptor isoform X2 [Miniopterus natalensis]